MQIIEFPDFARRRAARGALANSAGAGSAAPATDRWAALHSVSADSPGEPNGDEVDFWSDLNFRLAYPTHRMRQH